MKLSVPDHLRASVKLALEVRFESLAKQADPENPWRSQDVMAERAELRALIRQIDESVEADFDVAILMEV